MRRCRPSGVLLTLALTLNPDPDPNPNPTPNPNQVCARSAGGALTVTVPMYACDDARTIAMEACQAPKLLYP